ncbi:hypothetical protein GOC15_22785 [Sinorhizobium meliloti]|nr:hypothetical protein [Sinorhizobium meliloti]
MDSRDIITAAKTDIILGEWTDDKIRARDFPMSMKTKGAYPLTRRWRWQVSTFSALGRRFRVLAAYHTDIPEYTSVLAEDLGSDSRILIRWEFHQSHAGWHAHPNCGDVDEIKPGVATHAAELRLPAAQKSHRRKLFLNRGFAMDDTIAEAIACRRFGIPHNLDMLVSGALPWN